MTDRQVDVHLTPLHDKQQQVRDDPHRFKVLVAGRRFGKNILEHDCAMDGLLNGWLVGWGSPTYKNLTEDWRLLRNLAAPITSRALEQDHRIECITGGVLEMWSLDNPDPIRGRKYQRFIVNEAGFVPYLSGTWNEVLRSTLIDLKGDALIAGTPNGMNDYHTINGWGTGGQADWKSWHFTSYDNPHIDPAELDALKLTLSDKQFRQEILAEFIQSEGAVFRNLEAALVAPYQQPADHQGHMIVGGVDWGKSNDFTVLALGCCECKREVAIERFNQIDYQFQVSRLEAMAERWKVKTWRAEKNSIGDPIIEQLQRRGLRIVPFVTTIVSKQPLIESFSLALEKGDLQLLPDEAGRSELQAYEVKRTAAGNSTYSAPDGMHDDTVIARALMWQQMRETPAPDPKRQQQQREFSDARKVLFG